MNAEVEYQALIEMNKSRRYKQIVVIGGKRDGERRIDVQTARDAGTSRTNDDTGRYFHSVFIFNTHVFTLANYILDIRFQSCQTVRVHRHRWQIKSDFTTHVASYRRQEDSSDLQQHAS